MIRQVIKKDGSIEDYDAAKIKRVVTAAGLHPDQAETLATDITQWLNQLPDQKISSLEIRNKVVQELARVNQNAADLYLWYEQTKVSQTTQNK